MRPWAPVDKSDYGADHFIVYPLHVGRQVLHDFAHPQEAERYPQRRKQRPARQARVCQAPSVLSPAGDWQK